jgi:hypothetical protein
LPIFSNYPYLISLEAFTSPLCFQLVFLSLMISCFVRSNLISIWIPLCSFMSLGGETPSRMVFWWPRLAYLCPLMCLNRSLHLDESNITSLRFYPHNGLCRRILFYHKCPISSCPLSKQEGLIVPFWGSLLLRREFPSRYPISYAIPLCVSYSHI